METKNAVIKSTFLGVEDHGIFTFFLNLDYGSSGQGAGGYTLDDKPKKVEHRREGTAEGMSLIMEILKTVGVDKWESLPGKHIRAIADHEHVEAIGNILQDKWLNFKEFYAERGIK
jgi:hypothetical protein